MRRVNIANPTFQYDSEDPDGFKAGMYRIGPSLDAKSTGSTVYELPAGETLCPYHYEYGEEEWLLVLEGRPTVRHPGGSDQLDKWDLVFFPTGPEGAHRVQNDTEEPVRVLMYSWSPIRRRPSTPIATRSASGQETAPTTSWSSGRATSSTTRASSPDRYNVG